MANSECSALKTAFVLFAVPDFLLYPLTIVDLNWLVEKPAFLKRKQMLIADCPFTLVSLARSGEKI